MIDFSKYKKVLVLAVGGGNDSISTLLLQLQLNKSMGYNPEHIDICAVLPDCLDYHEYDQTDIELLWKITNITQRSVLGKKINAFPERILAEHKNIFKELNIQNIYGISMSAGSVGISKTIQQIVNDYDLLLSVDVGGDFVAHLDNIEVLSPMMDGYMLYALRELITSTDMIYSIFGLGTDGESTPDMLNKALTLLPDIEEYQFSDVVDFVSFYRNIVEKNRYSRTTDFTIQEIEGKKENDTNIYRARFHINGKVYYGNFEHTQDKRYYGKYYLFQDISKINNLFCQKSTNGIEWFLKVQNSDTKINHELNGQSYKDIGLILGSEYLKNKSLLFGTPSRKFDAVTQLDISRDIIKSVLKNEYDLAIIYTEYVEDIPFKKLNNGLSIISSNQDVLIVCHQILKSYI